MKNILVTLCLMMSLINITKASDLHHVCEDDANGVVHCDYNWND